MGARWTSSEVARLRRLRASTGKGGVRLESKFPGRSPGAISSMLARLDLVDPVRSAKAKERTQLSAAKHREFVTFLRERIAAHPPEELTRLWNESQADKPDGEKVTHDMTRYWVRKGRLRLSANEQETNPGYKRARRRRCRAIGRRKRLETESAMLAKLDRLRRRRTAVLRQKPPVPMHHCRRCNEDWPHTDEFFRRVGGELELHCCRFCANQRRRVLARARTDGEDVLDDVKDRHEQERRERLEKRAEERRAAARKVKDALLKGRRKCPLRGCLQCKEEWPLMAEFFAPSHHTDGAFSYFCRFCDADLKRAITCARRDHLSVAPLRAARTALLQARRDIERAERRATLTSAARRDRKFPRRTCPQCDTSWPLKEEYWYMSRTGAAKVPAKRICRCCVNDNETADRRA